MNFELKPGTREFVEQQVKSGNFASGDEVLEEAINRMMLESESELDDDTIAAINRAEEQLDRGEGISFDQFVTEWRQKLSHP